MFFVLLLPNAIQFLKEIVNFFRLILSYA